MRGLHNDDALGLFEHATASIERNHAAIDIMLGSLPPEADDRQLNTTAKDLARLGEGLIRTAKLIEKMEHVVEPLHSLEHEPALAWELDRLVANRYAGRRGVSVRSRNGIRAGTVFQIDDFWRENGVLVGVVWKTPDQRFDWLTPLELTTWTRPLPPTGRTCSA